MTDCFCDYDPPEFYHREIRKARKPHKCEECSGVIPVGETYEYVGGKWDGYIDNFKTCQRCVNIRMWVKNNVPCLCWAHGNGTEDCKVAVDEAVWRAPEETRGLRFGLLRRIIERDRINAEREARNQ